MDRIEWDVVELEGVVFCSEFHLQVSLDVCSPFVASIALAIERIWAVGAVEVEDMWVGIGFAKAVGFRYDGIGEDESLSGQSECSCGEQRA